MSSALKGLRILVTAGPTREPIDPVRFISNRSSGKMGYAIAGQAAMSGAKVTLVSGPVSIKPPNGVELLCNQLVCRVLEETFWTVLNCCTHQTSR